MRQIDADGLKERAKKALSKIPHGNLAEFIINGFISEIDNEPTINEWIPCEERLPSREEYQKCNGLFIVSDGNRTYSTYFDIYDTLRFGEPTIERFRIDKRVIAWMPLPQPYNKED